MRQLWITGPDAFRRARNAAQTRADLASRPVLIWRARRSPPTYLVDIVPNAWSEVDAAWLRQPIRIRATYRRQVWLLLEEVRRAVSEGERSRCPCPPEPLGTLRRLKDELELMHERLSSLDVPQELLVPASDPEVLLDEDGQYRLAEEPCPSAHQQEDQ